MAKNHAFMVAEALHKKTLSEDEIPKDVMDALAPLLVHIKEDYE